MATAPLLSIGMIFKNEERCLERCLKSLEPLRKAIPCELIMADTGAVDGSREIAERYADEVFDFEWIDDFSAARNAVMDRCSGKWYFSIDCDEWLDADISELISFLNKKKQADYAFVIQRNYRTLELEKSENYDDFHALRVIRMSVGQRYHGAIHESWYYREPFEQLTRVILHHDGYFSTSPKSMKNKMQRNMKLLREKLQEEPEDLRTLIQCIESGGTDADFVQYVRRAVDLVRRKYGQWERYGGCIMRHAVEMACRMEMPELDEWAEYAESQFPNSIFTQVDVNYAGFMTAHDAEDWEKAIRYGEAYKKGIHTLRSSKKANQDKGISNLHKGDRISERTLLLGLADAYFQHGQAKKALQILTQIEGARLLPKQVRNVLIELCQLHARTTLDIGDAMTGFYEQISQKTPDEKKQKARLAVFNAVSVLPFGKSYQDEEKSHTGYHRPAYTAFRCLADKCEAGRAAAIMMTSDPAEICEWLMQAEDWEALPIEALEHALQAGVRFPLGEKPLNIEVMDGLATKLVHDDNPARKMALALPEDAEFADLQSLYWAQALTLAALRSFDWTLGKNTASISEFARVEKKKEDTKSERPKDTSETGLALICRFAQVEASLLPLLYAPQALTEQNAALLPPMHRWGFYCSQALDALDAGRPQEYLAALRKGVAACPGQKEMVQFLLDRFMEDARPKTNPELLALAEKVRGILAAYGPDHPAAKAIRESDAYKQVAWMIEDEPNGGLPVQ